MLKRELGFPDDDVEFKFNKSRRAIREVFLKRINKLQYKIRILIIEKKDIRNNELRNNKNSFYSYTIKLFLKHSGGSVMNAKIRIDGSGDRLFRKSFIVYLRKQLNSSHAKIM